MRSIVLGLTVFALTCAQHYPGLRYTNPYEPLTIESKPELQHTPPAIASNGPPENYVPKILFSTDVNDASVDATIMLMDRVTKAGAKAIVIEINSPGGFVDAGFRLSKAIENSPVPVVCVVDGEADSMAFYILQSCHERVMTKRSSLMVHEPSLGGQIHGDQYEFDDLRRRLHVLSEALIQHIARRMKLSVDEIRTKIKQSNWWMNWQEALEVGAVDRVVDTVQEVLDELRN